jgi:hypothetical protein
MAAIAAPPTQEYPENELGKWGDMNKKETVLTAVAENG